MCSSNAVPYDTTPDQGSNDFSVNVRFDDHRAARDGCLANPKHGTADTNTTSDTNHSATNSTADKDNDATNTTTTRTTGCDETANAADVASGD